MRHLSYVGLVPSLVIDLVATKNEVVERFGTYSFKESIRRCSKPFFVQIFNEWILTKEEFRKLFDREYQVTTKIPISISNWLVYDKTKKCLISVFFEIRRYYNDVSKGCPLRLAHMKISPLEFIERQSSYKSFCPCCFHFSNDLVSGGNPPDRTGVVQYRKYFYWLCHDHIELFFQTPDNYLSPHVKDVLPQELPKRILNLTEMPENVAEEGLCVVCYKHFLKFVKGCCSHAVRFHNKMFVFDTEICLDNFMRKPQEYPLTIGFKSSEEYPALHYKDLPIPGMLEQYMALPIIKALQFISGRRPLIPGLNVATSALIGVGLFLKIYHTKISPSYKERYMKGAHLFHERRTQLISFLDAMKNNLNPFLYYEEPMPMFKKLDSNYSESSESAVD